MATRRVNERQLDVLSWIVSGCPPREWSNTTYKTVAVALQNRRLVTVSRKRGVWHAEATDAGRHFVEYGVYPANHWSAASFAQPKPPPPRAKVGATSSRPTRSTIKPPATTASLVGERASVATSTVTGAPVEAESAVRVPSRMSSRPHAAVKAIQGRPHSLAGLSKPLRPRVLRILDTLAKEAERRGYQVAERDGCLRIAVRGHSETIDLREPTTRTKHVASEAELAAHERDSWRRPPEWDVRPSGRLRAVVGHSDVVEPRPRKDGTVAWVLEERLDRVLGLVEGAVATKEHWERRRREEAETRRRRWEEVRAQAVIDFHDHRRVEVLRDQVERWEEGHRLDAFLRALDDHIAGLSEVDSVAAVEWRRWVADYVVRRSPFAEPVRMPPEVEPSASSLAPFMRGLSPYGP